MFLHADLLSLDAVHAMVSAAAMYILYENTLTSLASTSRYVSNLTWHLSAALVFPLSSYFFFLCYLFRNNLLLPFLVCLSAKWILQEYWYWCPEGLAYHCPCFCLAVLPFWP